ncbi:hypothetical protein PAMP_018150 [Pampus punctatissimus]
MDRTASSGRCQCPARPTEHAQFTQWPSPAHHHRGVTRRRERQRRRGTDKERQ